jgi:hypothetical protein
MEENKFIEKFKTKSTFELNQIIENPSSFENQAVEAAQHHLSNPTIKIEIKEKPKGIVEPIFKEKAFFKHKVQFKFAIIFILFSILFLSFLFKIYGGYKYLIWVTIQVLIFAVIISKSQRTVLYLKYLSIISISFIAGIYLLDYISLAENEEFIFNNRYWSVAVIHLAFLIEGEKLIEIKKVQTN